MKTHLRASFANLAHIGMRSLSNVLNAPKKFIKNEHLSEAPILAESFSELWYREENAEEFLFTAGKIQNLRIAALKLNGLFIPKGEIFSFWKHIGNPNIGNEFVLGREIKEGCIVPTKAGGICQLSNALYDAALNAGFEIVERHRHSQIISGSLAEKNRDATVKWNYKDLRFKASMDFRIEVFLTKEQLAVRYNGAGNHGEIENKLSHLREVTEGRKLQRLNNCLTCDNQSCQMHYTNKKHKGVSALTAFVLDQPWPEYVKYLSSVSKENAMVITPVYNFFPKITKKYQWNISSNVGVKNNLKGWLRRSLYFKKAKGNAFKKSIQGDEIYVQNLFKIIPYSATHLVISQNLLPELHRLGALAGRTYEVLMYRLPAKILQERLDHAKTQYEESATLNDFRAPHSWVNNEYRALLLAEKIITPSYDIFQLFPLNGELVPWEIQVVQQAKNTGNGILFPASGIGRKGAYLIKKLAMEMGFDLYILNGPTENAHFWEGVPIHYFKGDFSAIHMVVYPTFVEGKNVTLLKALALEKPIITTTASGLHPAMNVTMVGTENYQEWKDAILKQQMKN